MANSQCNTTPEVPHDVEEWRPAVGYEGVYEASNHGRIRSCRDYNSTCIGYVLKPRAGNNGYLRVHLRNKGKKTHLVHRLIAAAFFGPVDSKTEVNHKDGNKRNNHVNNLEYVTSAENKQHAMRTGLVASGERSASRKYPHLRQGENSKHNKLSANDVHIVRQMLAEGHSCVSIGKQFNVTRCAISKIKHGKNWVALSSS